MTQFYRSIRKANGPCIYGFLFTSISKFDKPSDPTKHVEEVVTGWEGVKKVFDYDMQAGTFSAELDGMVKGCFSCAVVGAAWGSAVEARSKYFDFIDHNEASKFLNVLDAKRKLQDTVTLGMGRGAFKWGIRIGAFSSLFICSSTLIGAYLGGKGLLENILAGMITGAVFKMNMGIRGAIAGGFVGACLGTAYGLLAGFCLWCAGVSSMREMNLFRHEFGKFREETAQKNLTKDIGDKFGPAHADVTKDLSKVEEPKSKE